MLLENFRDFDNLKSKKYSVIIFQLMIDYYFNCLIFVRLETFKVKLNMIKWLVLVKEIFSNLL